MTRKHVIRALSLLASGVLLLAPALAASARAVPSAAPTITSSIDRYISGQMAELHIPGLALALIVDGKVAYAHGYGVADPFGRPVTPDTPFILGSTSKQFTGIAIEQLIRAGRLGLDAPVTRYLPWFGTRPDPHARITIRELLSHTSGISESQGADANILDDGGPSDTLEANAHRLASEPLGASPGSRFEYTNANYNLLGYLVEVASGQPYAAYMRQHVFAPLGLRETFASKADAEAAGLAAGFYPWFGLVALPTPMPYPRSHLPAGFLISSVHDLATLVLAQLGHVPGGQSDVDASLLAATRTPLTTVAPSLSYAAGWYIQRFWQVAAPGEDPQDPALPSYYAHVGQAHTFRSFIGFVPDEGFGLVMTMNANDAVYPPRWDNLGDAVIRLALGRPPSTPVLYGDLLAQNARLAYVLGLLIQIAFIVWSLRARRWRRLAVFGAAVVNVAALALALVYAPSRAGESLLELMRLTPDIGLITAVSVVVAITWLVLTLRQARAEGRSAVSVAVS